MTTKYFIYITLFISLFSCSKKIEIDEKKVFKLNRYDNISSLDPINARTQANNWACNLIYNSLVKIDNNLEIKPDIAKSWEISADGKTYTFNLRKDVYFQKHIAFGKDSTRTVNANDFAFSFDRLKDPKSGGSGGWIMNNISTYKALNDSIFEIKLKEAYPAFLGLVSMKYASVVPKELFKNGNEEFLKHPIGTGPFQFKIWEDNVKIVFRKNRLYFEFDDKGTRLPYLEAVNMTFLPEKNSEFLELIKGNLDMMADLDPSYKDEILTPLGELNPKYSKDLTILKAPYLSTVYLCFYLDGENAVDIKLRQALNYGVDKEKIIKYMMKGQAFAADGGFIPKGLPGYSSKSGYKFNPDKARELINSYIKEKGQIKPIELTTVQEYVAICEYIAAEMAKLGLPIKVNVVPGPTMLEGKATGKFMLFRANWGADYPDAENFLSLYYSKNFAPEGPNYSHYKSSEFDQLYEKSFLINNPELRAKNYEEMDALMMKKAPILPLFYDQTTLFINKDVKNFSINPIKLLDLTRVYKE
ncbi:ABC transporter substrate-binding protein [Chishuiella sp.]|uniref:ABC transporter substrate-binding protein n=1 Tax=Chishuiella sp. TaxID=1969467 RepID=UPI0028ADD59B|nr:ABC transporter substrate-binding protein [Chishuiella sp.]